MTRPTPGNERGQDLVEFALVLPFIFMLTLGVMDLAHITMVSVSLAHAAREGARYGMVANPPTTEQIQARVVAAAPGVGLTPDEVQVIRGRGMIEVRITHATPVVTGFLWQALRGESTWTLSASSRMPTE